MSKHKPLFSNFSRSSQDTVSFFSLCFFDTQQISLSRSLVQPTP